MRKTNFILKTTACLFLAGSLFFTGCSPQVTPDTPPAKTQDTDFVSDFDVKITKDNFSAWALWTYDLKEYKGKKVNIKFSAEAAVLNNSTKDLTLSFPINMSGYPEIASKKFSPGKTNWTVISGEKKNIELIDNYVIYLSNYDLKDQDATIYLKNISVTVKEVTVPNISDKAWDKVDSLKAAYVDSGIFDHFGMAAEVNELKTTEIQGLVSRHSNTTTLGNECKPQWLLWSYSKPAMQAEKFTASNGKIIDVPVLPSSANPYDKDHGFNCLDNALQICKDNNIQMRGHVLTWHSQTFDWFFCKDYDISKGLLTDKDEMSARHEWYIKTVLEHVKDWEEKNNNGKHIIYTWDVVNEAVADDASLENYLRGSTPGTNQTWELAYNCGSNGGSLWYQIYQSDEFIVNAFRFANKYAPSDVTLCYNEYNEYLEYGTVYKKSGIIKVLQSVLSHKNDEELPTRLDAMAMQSHVEKFVSPWAYEQTMKAYFELGIDVQVTEIDFKWNTDAQKNAKGEPLGYACYFDNFAKPLEDIYTEYMNMFVKYAKSKLGNTNGVTSVTIWGIEDYNTWLNPKVNNEIQRVYFPLLFERNENNELVAKNAFFAVLEAAK